LYSHCDYLFLNKEGSSIDEISSVIDSSILLFLSIGRSISFFYSDISFLDAMSSSPLSISYSLGLPANKTVKKLYGWFDGKTKIIFLVASYGFLQLTFIKNQSNEPNFIQHLLE
jgi:hypothetical protein